MDYYWQPAGAPTASNDLVSALNNAMLDQHSFLDFLPQCNVVPSTIKAHFERSSAVMFSLPRSLPSLLFLSPSAAISGSAIRVLPGLKRTNWPQGSSSRTDRQTDQRGSNSFFEREGGRKGKSCCREIECLQLQFSLPSLGVGSVLSVDSPNKMASEQAGNKAFRQPTDRGRNTQGQCPKRVLILREKYTNS